MIHNPDSRLLLAASMVRNGVKAADIGCDHALLPIYLIKNKIAERVIATDIKKGPLKNAAENIKAAGLEDKIELRLCGGLDGILPEEADDIIICGMGGILIRDIISHAQWLKNSEKSLVLQPMTDSDLLRRWLYDNGFEISVERAAKAAGRIYSVIKASFCGKRRNISGFEAVSGGLVVNPGQAEKEYLVRQMEILKRRTDGMRKANVDIYKSETEENEKIISEIKCLLEGIK